MAEHPIYGMLEQSIEGGQVQDLLEFLAAHSNLPGPRGNIELAREFSRAVSDLPASGLTQAWQVCRQLAAISAADAPTGDPGEFVAFCGALGIATLGCRDIDRRVESLGYLRLLAEDERWRMREAVAMGIQDLVSTWGADLARSLVSWIGECTWLSMRAVAAGLAEPRLLGDREILNLALEHHRTIIQRIRGAPDRGSPQFRALRKGLGYTLSVLTVKAPEEGFRLMEEMLGFRDPDLTWIVKENIGKGRLLRAFPREVEALRGKLESRRVIRSSGSAWRRQR